MSYNSGWKRRQQQQAGPDHFSFSEGAGVLMREEDTWVSTATDVTLRRCGVRGIISSEAGVNGANVRP
ncbi:hypothetical protein BDV96DRAFT_589582 [Lophiotrema nucula]|uniref:Uncharacterized protein n=1 Tax=Lophiotrema nucula TaxID=690887 RepID=A0A6A5YJL2_9PLEO|nr:hypothetical protein BDV96DRAFT_589582 [Lophiotrema nucula]